ncbi:hypothetical protein HKCCE2091_08435 [Rhodobacterales bacterium HKCCE2091]|nr:hypothetical protein [Rhodobacterales bacterium HKCCE2091]
MQRSFGLHDWLLLIAGGGLVALGTAIGIGTSRYSTVRATHDTYYVVAHTHYILTAGFVLAIAATLFYALVRPVRHRWLSIAGHAALWMLLAGSVLTFAGQQVVWFRGDMPRRYTDYADSFETAATVFSIGGVLASAGMVVLAVTVVLALVRRISGRR